MYLGSAWGFDSELFETVVQADVVLDYGATETAGGVEAVQTLVDAVQQGFSDFCGGLSGQTVVPFCSWSLGQGSHVVGYRI